MSQTQFSKNEQAVSPMVGIMILTGVTLIMSTVILTIALSFQIPEVAPMSSILASPEYDTNGVIDISISHKGGDTLGSGDWWVSVVPAGNTPIYKKSSTEFRVGDEINTRIRTDGSGDYTVTRDAIRTNGIADPLSVGRYDVSIVVYPYNAEIMHITVQVSG